jgi:hypothetical protein
LKRLRFLTRDYHPVRENVCNIGVLPVLARWDKFALRREMATVIERVIRDTLDDRPETARAAA